MRIHGIMLMTSAAALSMCSMSMGDGIDTDGASGGGTNLDPADPTHNEVDAPAVNHDDGQVVVDPEDADDALEDAIEDTDDSDIAAAGDSINIDEDGDA